MNHNNPSIFTSKDSFNRKSKPTSRSTLPSPPIRRQSTPGCAEPNTIQATVTEQESVGQFATSVPSPSLAAAIRARKDKPRSPSPWPSNAERGPPPSPSAEAKVRSATLDDHVPTATLPARSLSHNRASPVTAPRSVPAKRKPTKESGVDESGPSSEPSVKRLKLRPKTKHTLDSHTFGPSAFGSGLSPPSPLFFSNSPRPRPTLPPRFSSSEAGAKMLSKARLEDSHVKTVSLARGTVLTPKFGIPNTPNRKSLERSVTDRSSSPEMSSTIAKDGIGGLIHSIGIVELLDQDDRPTFIVDLGDNANYGPGPLQVIFANASLKSYEGLQAAVSGLSSEIVSPGPKTFLQFKTWLLSAAVNGESLNVCLPPFSYATLVWSCSILRKRLRIVSGAFDTAPMTANSATPVLLAPGMSQTTNPAENAPMAEPPDYFFSVTDPTQPAMSDDHGSVLTEAIPTVELTKADISNGSPAIPRTDLSGATNLLPSPQTYVPSSSNGAVVDSTPGPSSLQASPPNESPSTNEDRSRSQISTVPSDAPFFDWTRLPVSDSMPQHIQFARSIDWASTSLGPIENWSSDLRQMCNLIMASPHPAAMYWGEDLIAIYNEAYILLAGQKHPSLMGESYRVAWAEIWDDVKDVFASAKSTGEATMKDDDCLFIKRSGYLEETYFSWSIIPMVGRDGSVMGLYNPAFEKTRRKIAERRMLTLREVGEKTASARDVKGFWAQVLDSFEFNEYDSPFLLLYSAAEENDSDSSSIHSSSAFGSRQCMLEGSLGVPKGHPAAPEQIDLKSGQEGFGPIFRDITRTGKPVLLEIGGRELPAHLLKGLESRGFGDPVRAVVVCPIHPTTGENVLGFLVLGVNPRRPYDDDYSLFVQLLARQLATSLASVVLFEEEIRRGQKAAQLAALDRIELSEQLAARTQEAIDSETKFSRMAEFAPVGMFIANSDGKITFANDTWYDISRVPKNSNMVDTWMEAIKPEDKSLVEKLWYDLVVNTKMVSDEFRFKAKWQDHNGNLEDTWALFSGYPEKDRDGRLKSIFGSITNISQQKWAEGIQTRKMEEAVELKRQQENFIDITSHEMRNPLSAILQCADEIVVTLTQFRQSKNAAPAEEMVANCLDAAQTISLCSQHQKRIVDDILTLSKLDSQLLLVTPVDAQPLTVVQRALKMHEGELQAADIHMKFVVDETFTDMDLDWVRFDPSRVLQVLINLTTNAIKFTGTEMKRTITVTISASAERPSELSNAPVKFFPTVNGIRDTMTDGEWGTGERVYIHFTVRDTGRGLSPEEKKLLFIRFSQASPRTHVQYGGSGLGLFISRELTELQGGEIGVESEAGKGSTFAFYVAARRSTTPPDASSDIANGGSRSDIRGRIETASASRKGQTRIKSAEDSQSGTTSTKSDQPVVYKVLIVEDNLVNQKVLSKQLKNLGTEVHLANHGGEALEKLMQSTYWRGESNGSGKRLELGVVLMDQEMPVMDGLTCTRKIRELEAEGKLTGHVPIIAVTANARAEQVQTALDAGMDDVVSKPFRIPELMPKIEELMERHPMPSSS